MLGSSQIMLGSSAPCRQLSNCLPVRVRASANRMRLAASIRASTEDDKPVVFVAGGIGRTGIRVVRELTERGYKVRVASQICSPSQYRAIQMYAQDQICSYGSL